MQLCSDCVYALQHNLSYLLLHERQDNKIPAANRPHWHRSDDLWDRNMYDLLRILRSQRYQELGGWSHAPPVYPQFYVLDDSMLC